MASCEWHVGAPLSVGPQFLGIARTCAFFVVVIVAVVDGGDKKTRTKIKNARGTDVRAMAREGAGLLRRRRDFSEACGASEEFP